MSDENKSRLAIVCVTVTNTRDIGAFLLQAERQFQGCSEEHFAKMDDNIFLVDLDACYPAVLKVIDYCNQSNQGPGYPTVRVLISELSGSPLILSPEHQAALGLATRMGHRVRLTKFPPPAQEPQRA